MSEISRNAQSRRNFYNALHSTKYGRAKLRRQYIVDFELCEGCVRLWPVASVGGNACRCSLGTEKRHDRRTKKISFSQDQYINDCVEFHFDENV